MLLALLTSFTASKKEPLMVMMDRVRQAFLDAGLGQPSIQFSFGDPMVPGFTSSVDRVLKRYPELSRFVTNAAPMPGVPGARRISNGPASAAAGEVIPYETLQAIAAGVPRSFPFHSVVLHFSVDEFGDRRLALPGTVELLPGVLLSDSWWVNGRVRSLSACTLVDAEPSAKLLPPLPPRVAAVLAACGKVKKTVQAALPSQSVAAPMPVAPPLRGITAGAKPETALAVQPVLADYRARMPEILERAALPHDLPPQQEALRGGRRAFAGVVSAGELRASPFSKTIAHAR
jgi:hypothetical protein